MVKGQVATEFFLYTGVFLIIVIATFAIVSSLQANEVQYSESILSREVGDSFADSTNLAIRSGEGFRFNMTFKKSLFSSQYEIFFDSSNRRLFLNWLGTYGEVSNFYPIAPYDYKYLGCMQNEKNGNGKLVSSKCSNQLDFYNNGSTLFIEQPY